MFFVDRCGVCYYVMFSSCANKVQVVIVYWPSDSRGGQTFISLKKMGRPSTVHSEKDVLLAFGHKWVKL